MFSDLASKATEALGKSYLLAGLIPAVVSVIALAAMWFGVDTAFEQIHGLLEKEGATALTLAGCAVLVLSFLLTVTRNAIVAMFEGLPGPLFAHLRGRLTERALQAVKVLDGKKAVLEAEYTALAWLRDGGALPGFIPPAVAKVTWQEASRISEKALPLITEYAKGDQFETASVPENLMRDLRHSALSLVALAVSSPGHVKATAELNNWRAWVTGGGEPPKIMLRLTSDAIQRELSEVWTQRARYPVPRWIRPTRLGNRFSAYQDYAERRYGISTKLLWEHLWWILPKQDRGEIADTRVWIESLVVTSLCSAALAAAAVPLLILRCWQPGAFPYAPSAGPWTIFAIALLFAACGRASYKLSLLHADTFVGKIISLIDVHRLRLLKAVGASPQTVEEEVELFRELNNFWIQGTPRLATRPLTMPAEKKEEAAGDEGKAEKDG